MLRYAPGSAYRDTTHVWSTTLPYTLRGAKLTIGRECPPDPRANCAGPAPGHVLGGVIYLQPVFSRSGWAFARVGQ